jgi:hypothetical protein
MAMLNPTFYIAYNNTQCSQKESAEARKARLCLEAIHTLPAQLSSPATCSRQVHVSLHLSTNHTIAQKQAEAYHSKSFHLMQPCPMTAGIHHTSHACSVPLRAPGSLCTLPAPLNLSLEIQLWGRGGNEISKQMLIAQPPIIGVLSLPAPSFPSLSPCLIPLLPMVSDSVLGYAALHFVAGLRRGVGRGFAGVHRGLDVLGKVTMICTLVLNQVGDGPHNGFASFHEGHEDHQNRCNNAPNDGNAGPECKVTFREGLGRQRETGPDDHEQESQRCPPSVGPPASVLRHYFSWHPLRLPCRLWTLPFL